MRQNKTKSRTHVEVIHYVSFSKHSDKMTYSDKMTLPMYQNETTGVSK
jgi:hypothetical protein